GSHFQKSFVRMTYAEAKRYFLQFNRWATLPGADVLENAISLEAMLPEEPLIADSAVLTYPEQLDLSIRQSAWIRRGVVAPEVDSRLPFADPDWMRYMLAVQPEGRAGCAVYHRIMHERFPEIFSIRTKSVSGGYIAPNPLGATRVFLERALRAGLRRLGCTLRSQTLNYIDFDAAFRDRADFRLLAQTMVSNLDASGTAPWIKIGDIYVDHLAGRLRAGHLMQTLVSLDVGLTISNGTRRLTE